MHGRGVYIWKDGTKYEGNFLNGKIEGVGHYLNKDGKILAGLFKNGKYSKDIKIS
jgi:hypothetical protein